MGETRQNYDRTSEQQSVNSVIFHGHLSKLLYVNQIERYRAKVNLSVNVIKIDNDQLVSHAQSGFLSTIPEGIDI